MLAHPSPPHGAHNSAPGHYDRDVRCDEEQWVARPVALDEAVDHCCGCGCTGESEEKGLNYSCCVAGEKKRFAIMGERVLSGLEGEWKGLVGDGGCQDIDVTQRDGARMRLAPLGSAGRIRPRCCAEAFWE
jgi:hypothetical protein